MSHYDFMDDTLYTYPINEENNVKRGRKEGKCQNARIEGRYGGV